MKILSTINKKRLLFRIEKSLKMLENLKMSACFSLTKKPVPNF